VTDRTEHTRPTSPETSRRDISQASIVIGCLREPTVRARHAAALSTEMSTARCRGYTNAVYFYGIRHSKLPCIPKRSDLLCCAAAGASASAS
jgi:hypothetical protein